MHKIWKLVTHYDPRLCGEDEIANFKSLKILEPLLVMQPLSNFNLYTYFFFSKISPGFQLGFVMSFATK